MGDDVMVRMGMGLAGWLAELDEGGGAGMRGKTRHSIATTALLPQQQSIIFIHTQYKNNENDSRNTLRSIFIYIFFALFSFCVLHPIHTYKHKYKYRSVDVATKTYLLPTTLHKACRAHFFSLSFRFFLFMLFFFHSWYSTNTNIDKRVHVYS